jgi:hypothetical protein
VLVLGERRGRLTEQETARFLRDISRLRISLDRTPDEMPVLTLTRRHKLTVYDAAYLELALREVAALATLDQRSRQPRGPKEFRWWALRSNRARRGHKAPTDRHRCRYCSAGGGHRRERPRNPTLEAWPRREQQLLQARARGLLQLTALGNRH